MKKFLFVLMAAVLGLATVSCRCGKDFSLDDGGYSFRKTTWGMSLEEVKASEDSAPTEEKPGVITYRGEFEGKPVIIGYVFDGDKLVKAGYFMQAAYEDPNSYISDYDKVKDFLIGLYGSPAQDEVLWAAGEETDDPDKFGEAACGGKLRYSTMWVDDRTVIKETLKGGNGQCKHGVMFESIEHSIKKEIEIEGTEPVTPPGP